MSSGGSGSGGVTGSTGGKGGTPSGGATSTGGQANGGSTGTGGAAGGAGGQPPAACGALPQGSVSFSQPSGTFQNTLSVTMTTTVSGAEIRYTTDGKAPGSSSTLYASPVSISKTTQLRAQAFVGGAASGSVTSALYVARAIEGTHDLPVIILDSYGSGKLPTAEAQRQFVNVAYLEYMPAAGNTVSISTAPTSVSLAAFHVRGNSSAMFDKVPYRLELRDQAGDDLDCSVLGMPEESDWAMVGPHADKTLIHNNFIYDLGREMGLEAPRVKLAEVYVNVDNTPLAADDYQGVYQIVETIKNNKRRLDLKQLDETKTSDTDITGGYIFSFEWSITAENPITCPAGTPYGWNYMDLIDPVPITDKQKEYLTNHLLSFNSAMHGSNISDASNGYPKYLETKTFVDTVILAELTRNIDGLTRSQYFFKDRDKKINAGPLWDFDVIAGVGVAPGMMGGMANTAAEGWQYEVNASRMVASNATKADGGVRDAGRGGGFPAASSGTTDWFPLLIADPAFKSQLIARWKELRQGVLSDSAMAARIDQVSKGLSAAADRNFKRWPILSQAKVNPFDTPTEATWAGQIEYMKTWLSKRAAWIDSQWK